MFLFTKYLNNIFSQFFHLPINFVLWCFALNKKYLILIRLNQPNIPIKVCALFISFKKLFSMQMLKNIYIFSTNNFIVLSFTV